MEMDSVGFLGRLWLACWLPWKLIFDGLFAGRVQALLGTSDGDDVSETPVAPGVEEEPEPIPTILPIEAESVPLPEHADAMQILAILQREGRFVDFLQEDMSQFSDADVGAAARVVFEGCKRAMSEYVSIEPVRNEAEGDPVVLNPGFDPASTQVTGNVVGEPPFHGRLAHHGWRIAQIKLPTISDGHDPSVVAPAEVEIE
ncbi:MAG: DUF2760 domain-containing protein [Proteobacteria bacterium]|jgi:hypothetical protein|nr:DUF2760 domain-containing protein [Pseudomonadota bacterium]